MRLLAISRPQLWSSHLGRSCHSLQAKTRTYSHTDSYRTRPPYVSPKLPLSNLRVLDFSRVLAGPFCTQILADYGATVLKVEQPGTGDETRQWRSSGEAAQIWDDKYLESVSTAPSSGVPLMSLYFASINRNKRSMTLNLKSPHARKLVKELLDPRNPEAYDIVVHNFLPQRTAQMGIDYETLKSINPSIIYAAISGYGASGASTERAGYDAIALSEAGLLHITGTPETPIRPGVAVADLSTGLYTHGAILAAVNARNNNGGLGCKIDASLFESSLSLLINVGLASLNLDLDKGPENRRRGSRLGLGHSSLVPYGGYKTRDGRVLFIAANNTRQWKLFCERLSIPEEIVQRYISNDARLENRAEVLDILGKRFAEKDLKEWENIFEGSGLPYGPINDVVEAMEHPQAQARNMILSVDGVRAARDGMVKLIGPAVKFGSTVGNADGLVRIQPPLLGEHTDEVLGKLGYSACQIQKLRKDTVI